MTGLKWLRIVVSNDNTVYFTQKCGAVKLYFRFIIPLFVLKICLGKWSTYKFFLCVLCAISTCMWMLLTSEISSLTGFRFCDHHWTYIYLHISVCTWHVIITMYPLKYWSSKNLYYWLKHIYFSAAFFLKIPSIHPSIHPSVK